MKNKPLQTRVGSAAGRPGLVKTAKNSRNRYRQRQKNGRGYLTRFLASLFGLVWKTSKVVFSGVFLVVLLGSLSAGLILGYHYLMNSDYFMVRKVVLGGLQRVTRAEVLNLTGLDKPCNILAVKLGPMAASLRGVPWVQDVTITRKLPDTIIVQVKERRPTTLISLGSLYYLDADCKPFKKVDPQENPEMPIITGFTRADFSERREFVKKDLDEIYLLLEVLAARNDRFRIENISEINFDPVRGLSLFTRDEQIQVKVGFGDYQKKFWRLGRVLANLKINGQYDSATYFNLECSPRVIVRQAAQS